MLNKFCKIFFTVLFLSSCAVAENLKEYPTASDVVKKAKWLSDSDTSIILPGDYAREIKVDGRKRIYKFHIPASSRYQKRPVVLVFHGGGGFPDIVRYQSDFDSLSEKEGFIVVYPAGNSLIFNDTLLTFNGGICCSYAKNQNINDVKFVDELLTDLKKYAKIDEKMIFATGMSNGALLSYRLASELSDKIAAIAPVASQVKMNEFKLPSRAVPILHFHGLQDKNAPFAGGVGENSVSKTDLPSVYEVLSEWARFNGCLSELKPLEKSGQAEKKGYLQCRDNADVSVWILRDGGHTWPGGRITRPEVRFELGKVSHDISATQIMWEFFKTHPLK